MTRQLVEIGSLGKVVTGDTPPKKNPEYYGSAYPFIKPTDMQVGQRYTYVYDECYSEAAYEKYRKKLIPEGATAVVTIGSIGQKLTLTHTACFVNQAVNAVIPNNEEFNSLYVYYLLKHNLNLVKNADTGASSGRENVSKSNFSKLQVLATLDTKEQERIAQILDGYDSLIENNQRQIALLEESVRLLYREWFVSLRFPGHESVMVKEGIPEGWRRVPFGQTIDLHIGGGWGKEYYESNSPDAAYVIRGTDIPRIQKGDVGGVPLRFHPEKNLASRQLELGDIVFEVSGGSRDQGVGRLLHLTSKLLDQFDKPVMCASFCKLIRPKQGLSELLTCTLDYLRSSAALKVFENQSASNIINFAFTEFCKKQEVLIPDELVLHAYRSSITPIWEQIGTLARQQAKLAQVRDLLLPKLMSGEIQV